MPRPDRVGEGVDVRRRAVVVGSGAGGATVARELQGAFDVTVVEAGREFQRATLERESIERLRRSRLLVDPGLVRFVYPPIRIRRTPDMLLVQWDRDWRDDHDGDRERDPAMDRISAPWGSTSTASSTRSPARSRSRPRTSAGGTPRRDACSARSTISAWIRSSCRRWATPSAADTAAAACSAALMGASGTAARTSTKPFGAAPG